MALAASGPGVIALGAAVRRAVRHRRPRKQR
jgi:hypothetical protein